MPDRLPSETALEVNSNLRQGKYKWKGDFNCGGDAVKAYVGWSTEFCRYSDTITESPFTLVCSWT